MSNTSNDISDSPSAISLAPLQQEHDSNSKHRAVTTAAGGVTAAPILLIKISLQNQHRLTFYPSSSKKALTLMAAAATVAATGATTTAPTTTTATTPTAAPTATATTPHDWHLSFLV